MGCTSSKSEMYVDVLPVIDVHVPDVPDDSDEVDDLMRLDKGLDEVEVDYCLDDYPDVEPESSGEGICFSSPSKWAAGGNVTLPTRRRRRRPISPLQTMNRPQISFEEVDEHARKATLQHGSSFEVLLEYLKQPIKSTSYPQVLLARALVAWLGNQTIEKTKYGDANVTTPNGLLQYLKERRMTYATCYTILCRKAGIKCVLVKGIAKAGSYEPGDNDPDKLKTAWTALHVDGNWQIVNPFWVCKGLIGKNFAGWVKLESDGHTSRQKVQASAGVIRNAFQDYYFMPKPSEYSHECYPNETKWQLLPEREQVRSYSQFFRKPHLLPPFFGYNMKLISEQACELSSTSGTSRIQIKCQSGNAYHLSVSYELFLKDSKDSDDAMVQNDTLKRVVLWYREQDNFIFEIRYPVEGVYKLVLYGGSYGSPLLRISEFKLNCEKKKPGCNLLLKVSGIGWGPGPVSEDSGLLLPTKQSGIIPMKPRTARGDSVDGSTSIKFQLHPKKMLNRQYTADLIASDFEEGEEVKIERSEFKGNIHEISTDRAKRQLSIRASIPKDGEYALVIKSGECQGDPNDIEKGTDEWNEIDFKPVCNYLLTSYVTKQENPRQRFARNALIQALDVDDIELIEKALEKCRKEKMDESDDDFCAAEMRLEFLQIRKALYDCILRRNLGVTEKSLILVADYDYADLVEAEIKRVKRLKAQLIQLGGFTKEIPGLLEASHELTVLQNPSAEVYNTIKALFLLVGYKEADIYDWYFMQSKMRFTPEQRETVFKQMEAISEKNIAHGTRRKITAMLSTTSQEQVRHASQSAARIYIWIRSVLEVYEKTDTTADAA